MTVVYDDIATDVKRAVSTIHNFLGLPVDDAAYARLSDNSSIESHWGKASIHPRIDIRGLWRGSQYTEEVIPEKTVTADERANRWRQQLSPLDSSRILSECKEFYNTIKYAWAP